MAGKFADCLLARYDTRGHEPEQGQTEGRLLSRPGWITTGFVEWTAPLTEGPKNM